MSLAAAEPARLDTLYNNLAGKVRLLYGVPDRAKLAPPQTDLRPLLGPVYLAKERYGWIYNYPPYFLAFANSFFIIIGSVLSPVETLSAHFLSII
jgi:hypothetical protein